MSIISDGTGTGSLAKVTPDNRLKTVAVTEDEEQHSVAFGDGYNINTGVISLTGATETAVFYLKNNEERDLVISAIACGFGQGTQSDPCMIRVVRNPLTGDILTTPTNVGMNQNRNFGSSKTLDADAYKGADGETFNDGMDIALLFANQNSRLFATLGFVLEKGDTIGLTIDPNLSSGSINVYAAVICHLQDEALID